MKMIFDTHAHYDDAQFDCDREDLLASMKEAGVGRIVNVCADFDDIDKTIALIEKYPFMFGAAGVHPTSTGVLTEENFSKVRQAAMHSRVLAIGEIGLDYYWDDVEPEIQKVWFRRQLELAEELKLPFIVHSREAAKDTIDIIREVCSPQMSAVIHCFSYSVEMAREYLNMGYYLGIGGVVTYKNGRKLKEVAEYTPLDRILLETDAPYLSPVPFRGKRNSSEKIHYVVEEIARLKGITEEEVLEATWQNACRFYGLTQEDTLKSV